MTNAMIPTGLTFAAAVEMIAPDGEQSVGQVARSSARVYRVTFERWGEWCALNQCHPLTVNYVTVKAYLEQRDVSKASKLRELSALRQLAHLLAMLNPHDAEIRAALDSLQYVKVRANETDIHREKRALSPADADRMLRVWTDDDTPRGKRNRAIVAVALLSGLRRAEIAVLRWSDVDLTNGVIHVRHGKGDKARDSALYGDEWRPALTAWQMAQPMGYDHIFVGLRKGGNFKGDAPMSGSAIWRIVVETAEIAGIGHVKPHDLRRSLATELLETGSPVHHVQQQLGHADSATTLNNYTGETDARQRRKVGRVRYG